jgi:predicted transcriptional regulator of viral defense system
MEALKVLKRLEEYPTFDVTTIANIIGKDETYAKVYLNRLKNRGIVQQLQRNVYTVQDDPLIIASRIVWPSYISIWAALRYHNLTEQIPNTISVVTTRAKNRRSISIKKTKVIFERIQPTYFFGFSKIRLKDFEIFMGEPEKALIDAVLLKKISVTEVYFIFKANLNTISIGKTISYIKRTHNKSLAKRFGWMLNSLGCKNAEELETMTYKTMIPLDYSRPMSGLKDKKWGIIVNIGGI